MKTIYISIAIAFLALLLLGAEGCPTAGPGTSGTGGSNYGVDFSPATGVGYLSAGKSIYLGDAVNVKVHLENYDTQGHSGKLCVKDNIAEEYGGISEDCQNFILRNAEMIKSGSSEQLQSSKTDIVFPTDAEYSYHDIPINQQVKLFIELQYVQSAKVTGAVNVPTPETEKLVLEQNPALVTADIEKTIRKTTDGYKVDLGITLKKVMSDAKIYSPDFGKENSLSLKFENTPMNFKCTPDLGTFGLIEDFEITKFIRCSAVVNEDTVSYPLIISLDYGVKVTREYGFNINVLKEEMK